MKNLLRNPCSANKNQVLDEVLDRQFKLAAKRELEKQMMKGRKVDEYEYVQRQFGYDNAPPSQQVPDRTIGPPSSSLFSMEDLPIYKSKLYRDPHFDQRHRRDRPPDVYYQQPPPQQRTRQRRRPVLREEPDSDLSGSESDYQYVSDQFYESRRREREQAYLKSPQNRSPQHRSHPSRSRPRRSPPIPDDLIIDQVPTAFGYESDDSGFVLMEERSKGSRYRVRDTDKKSESEDWDRRLKTSGHSVFSKMPNNSDEHQNQYKDNRKVATKGHGVSVTNGSSSRKEGRQPGTPRQGTSRTSKESSRKEKERIERAEWERKVLAEDKQKVRDERHKKDNRKSERQQLDKRRSDQQLRGERNDAPGYTGEDWRPQEEDWLPPEQDPRRMRDETRQSEDFYNPGTPDTPRRSGYQDKDVRDQPPRNESHQPPRNKEDGRDTQRARASSKILTMEDMEAKLRQMFRKEPESLRSDISPDPYHSPPLQIDDNAFDRRSRTRSTPDLRQHIHYRNPDTDWSPVVKSPREIIPLTPQAYRPPTSPYASRDAQVRNPMNPKFASTEQYRAHVHGAAVPFETFRPPAPTIRSNFLGTKQGGKYSKPKSPHHNMNSYLQKNAMVQPNNFQRNAMVQPNNFQSKKLTSRGGPQMQTEKYGARPIYHPVGPEKINGGCYRPNF